MFIIESDELFSIFIMYTLLFPVSVTAIVSLSMDTISFNSLVSSIVNLVIMVLSLTFPRTTFPDKPLSLS